MATKEAAASAGGRNSERKEENTGDGLSLSGLAFVTQQPETSSAQGGEEQVQPGGMVKTSKSAAKRKKKKRSKKMKNRDITAGNAKGNRSQSPPADEDAHLVEGRSSTEKPSIGDEHSCEEPSGTSTGKKEKEKENKGVTSLDCNSGDDCETAELDIASKHVAGMSSAISGDNILKEPSDGQATLRPEKDGPQTDFIKEDNVDSREAETMSKIDIDKECDKELSESKPQDIVHEQVKRNCNRPDLEGARMGNELSNTLASGRLGETGDNDCTELSDSEDNTNVEMHQEGRNILCIFKLVYGVGLQALRDLFMQIHPKWTNQPSDAAALDKGRMRLDKNEEVIFNKGDINQWDFSLITSTLLFSKICAIEISKKPGCDTALQELKKTRNKLLGHPCTDRMSNTDFNIFWPQLCNNFVALGADRAKIVEIQSQSDEQLQAGSYYKGLFLAENKRLRVVENKMDKLESKMDTVIEIVSQLRDGASKEPLSPKDSSGQKWDDWLSLCDAVGDFDTKKNQYVLITDSLTEEDLDYFSTLRSIPWKLVLDFDTFSEAKGMYSKFTSLEGQGNLISMITPAELKRFTMARLLRYIDASKTQWLFVKGRASDMKGKSNEFADWEVTSVKEISRFFACCCDPDKFDKQKPVVCLILPFCQKSIPYFEVSLSRLFENFVEFRLRVVSFSNTEKLSVLEKVKLFSVDLSPKLVHLGLTQLFSPSEEKYRMPTSQADLYYHLNKKEYLYLREHLEVLYDRCEELPTSDYCSDDELQHFLDEHRKLFISGNQISFPSLYDNHDAKRQIEDEIRNHVQRLLDKSLTRSMIVEIKHSPGSGGTTIARRVLWELHKSYPCAFIEIHPHIYFDEDNTYVNNLADRIAALEEMCETSPVILLDAKQSNAIESVSNKLVRMLGNKGRRALLLRCQHGSKSSSKETQEPSVHVHKVFYVDVNLEDSVADLNEFKTKYNGFIEKSLGEKISNVCRVFHFPLLAMMQSFRPKLKKIIHDTWGEMEGIQREIAIVVAFVQLYANQETPALLLCDAFQKYIVCKEKKSVTYEDIKQLFTEHLLNLMVPSNRFRRRARGFQFEEVALEKYTMQHRLVAEMLLRKARDDDGYDLFRVVNQFLQFPIFQREEFMPLFEELFVFNKGDQKKRKFSVLFEDLKANCPNRAAEVFCEAAEKTNDSVIFSNAARFYAKMEPPSFPKAMELINRAFEASNAKQRCRSLCHTKGVVLYIELKRAVNTGKVRSLEKLQELASKVLDAYRDARNFPPTYPNPLIGEVQVWLVCIGWIKKNKCDGDSEKALTYLVNQCPEFFRSCVSHSFCLLDLVDRIIQSVPSLPDPEDTQKRCNDARLSLMMTFRTTFRSSGRGRDAEDLVQACQALCSSKNFPRSSTLELKRLQVLFMLNSDDPIDSLKQEHLQYLQTLLGDLVFEENECHLAYHLIKVSVLVTGPKCYSLDQGLAVTEKWLKVAHDGLPYFYQMAIYFLKILDGEAPEFFPKYSRALKACREKSRSDCRSSHSSLFVSKDGDGMSRLVTRNTLFRGETDYSTAVQSETVPRFWQVDIRKKLCECTGRIRVPPSSDRGKTNPFIELIEGKVELSVGKNAGIGKVDRDFTQGQLAYFVTSFSLRGPVANGITFEPKNPSSSSHRA
ncbi:PREDICTED: uncharacterized protein LOC107344948 [Acropora digitifera]|uniref:uncharacterized protein LOC107344948 n=1 Tax=Acropora digitifera TaxID=70779 RepID=UPI000779F2BC|nr:PREDICTED: uncharacterized protein LOC107344948 [Acropora digitifera]